MHIVQNHLNDVQLHIFANTLHWCKLYITRVRCQEVFQISAFLLQYKKIKLLNFIQRYTAKKYETSQRGLSVQCSFGVAIIARQFLLQAGAFSVIIATMGRTSFCGLSRRELKSKWLGQQVTGHKHDTPGSTSERGHHIQPALGFHPDSYLTRCPTSFFFPAIKMAGASHVQ